MDLFSLVIVALLFGLSFAYTLGCDYLKGDRP